MVSEVTFVIKITLPRTTVDMNIDAPIRALEERGGRGKERKRKRGRREELMCALSLLLLTLKQAAGLHF